MWLISMSRDHHRWGWQLRVDALTPYPLCRFPVFYKINCSTILNTFVHFCLTKIDDVFTKVLTYDAHCLATTQEIAANASLLWLTNLSENFSCLQDMAYTLATGYVASSILLSGFYLRISAIKYAFCRGLSWLSYTKYAMQAMGRIELLGRVWSPDTCTFTKGETLCHAILSAKTFQIQIAKTRSWNVMDCGKHFCQVLSSYFYLLLNTVSRECLIMICVPAQTWWNFSLCRFSYSQYCIPYQSMPSDAWYDFLGFSNILHQLMKD